MNRAKADKKQKLTSDDEEDFETQGEGDIDELFMDEEEKERFNQMSEKEREIEIFKRLEQREIMRTREQIKRKLEMAAGKKGGGPDSKNKKKKRRISEGSGDDLKSEEDGEKSEEGEVGEQLDEEEDESEKQPGPSSKTTGKKVVIKEELNEAGETNALPSVDFHKPSELANKQSKKKAMADLLSKRRDKKQAEEKRKKEAQKAALDLDEIFGNEEGEIKSASSSSSSSTTSSRSSSPVSSKERSPSPAAKQEIQTKAELVKCQVFRRRLARFVHASFFAKTVIGCFVRILIGNKEGKPTYRIAQIVDVVETAKVYEVEPNTDIRTNKGFKLKMCNNESQRVMRLEFVSNTEFTDNEFAFWINRMRETNTLLPTVDFVERKQKEALSALSYNFTDADINLMVKEKQRFKRQPTNFAFQKAELLKMKEHAEQSGDVEKVRDLQQQINDLDEKSKKIENQRNKNLNAVTAINQRNREHMKQNFLEKALVAEFKEKDEDDPFTRKSARMKVVSGMSKTRMTSDTSIACQSSSLSSAEGIISSLITGSTSSMASSSSDNVGRQLLPSVHDLFSAHGIDINIELKLPATMSNSFIGRAPANTDSQIARGTQKPNTSRTLTLEEYKKKYMKSTSG